MSESAIERKVVKEAEKLGVTGIKLASPGNTGLPDRIFLIPGGGLLFIEFKKPGEKQTPKQLFWETTLKGYGQKVEVHDNVGQALQAITKALDAARLPDESA